MLAIFEYAHQLGLYNIVDVIVQHSVLVDTLAHRLACALHVSCLYDVQLLAVFGLNVNAAFCFHLFVDDHFDLKVSVYARFIVKANLGILGTCDTLDVDRAVVAVHFLADALFCLTEIGCLHKILLVNILCHTLLVGVGITDCGFNPKAAS